MRKRRPREVARALQDRDPEEEDEDLGQELEHRPHARHDPVDHERPHQRRAREEGREPPLQRVEPVPDAVHERLGEGVDRLEDAVHDGDEHDQPEDAVGEDRVDAVGAGAPAGRVGAAERRPLDHSRPGVARLGVPHGPAFGHLARGLEVAPDLGVAFQEPLERRARRVQLGPHLRHRHVGPEPLQSLAQARRRASPARPARAARRAGAARRGSARWPPSAPARPRSLWPTTGTTSTPQGGSSNGRGRSPPRAPRAGPPS